MKNIIIVSAAILIIISLLIIYCPTNDKYYTGIALSSEQIVNSDSLGMPSSIAYSDNKLCIVDNQSPYGENKILVYNVLTNRKVTVFGKAGAGPGEFRGPRSLNSIPGKKGFFSVYDIYLLRLTVFNITDENKVNLNKIIQLRSALPYEIMFVDENKLFSLGFSIASENRMVVFDTTGGINGYIGELLPGKAKSTPPAIHNQACKGVVKITPDGKHAIVSAQYTDYLDIYDNTGRLEQRINGPKNILPIYDVVNVSDTPVMAINDEKTKYGYIDVACSNEYIYALFSGNSFKENYEGNIIHVYDHQGNLFNTYMLDQKISFITIDIEHNKIYGVKLFPQPSIREFILTN
jgi:hypothetical protein